MLRFSRLRLIFKLTIVLLVLSVAFTSCATRQWPQDLALNALPLVHANHQSAPALVFSRETTLGTKTVTIGGGGYVTGIYLHPREQDLVYIKTDVGGFYRWNINQFRWEPLTDRFPLAQSNYYGGESLALDPQDPSVVYIAAGKYTADWSKELGSIFKSTDRGKTWKKLNLDLKMGGNEDLRWVGERLAVNPGNSQEILFGSRLDGLWKSADAGITWKQMSFPGKSQAGIGITSVIFDPKTANLVYAIAYSDGIYQSKDGGLTWKKLVGSPSLAKRMALSSNGVLYVTHAAGVSRYEKDRWRDITPFGVEGSFNAISIAPQAAQHVLVSLGETDKTRLFLSLDGGFNWTEKQRSVNNTVPWWSDYMQSQPWVSAIAFDPHHPKKVWLTDWYGIWQTENIYTNPGLWTNYQQGHEELVTFSLLAPPKGALLLSGVADVDGFYHDNGLDAAPSQSFSRSRPTLQVPSLRYRSPAFQDTYSIAYYQQDPLKLVRVGGNRFNSTYNGATSSDGGETWRIFADFPRDTLPMRVAISATDPDRFIVTVSGGPPLLTTNNGQSWRKVSGLPDGVQGPWNWAQSLAADPVNGNTFYYYADGIVYRSSNGGISFESINDQLPNAAWHALKTVPDNPGEVWLSLDRQGLYHSRNGGRTFAQLPQVQRAYLFAFGLPQPGSSTPTLYLYGNIAGMGEGIFHSGDRGNTWTRLGNTANPIGNDPNVMEASWQEFGLVFVGTNGRGIYYGSK